MKTELRLTDTNAASDSKGRTWGLEGGLFWWLVGGVGVAITVFFVLLVMMNTVVADRLSRRARAGRPLPRLHLRTAAGQAARLRPRLFRALGFRRWFRPGGSDHPLTPGIRLRRTDHECWRSLIVVELLRRTLLGQLQTAEVNLRAGLHQHGLDAIVRAHLERALAHIREAYIAVNEQTKSPRRFRNWPTSLRALSKCRPTGAPNKRSLTHLHPQSTSDLCSNALPTVFLSAI